MTGLPLQILARLARRIAAGALAAVVTLAATACGEHAGADDRTVQPVTANAPAPVVDAEERFSITPPAPRPTGPLSPEAGCVTSECHATFTTARFVHFAIAEGNCSVCHEPDQGGHHYPLTRAGNETCSFCHAVTGSRRYEHAAIGAHGCTACHDPHASQTKFLLSADSTESLCLGCHAWTPRARPHGPVAGGECSACHLAHDSNFENLLRGGDGSDHCFMCHAETEMAVNNAAHVHAPALESCTTCHDPHGADHAHGLRQSIETTCFGCHQDLETQVAGSKAPHAAVFTAEKCANCHDPHAAGRPKLLRERQDALCLMCHEEAVQATDGRTIQAMGPLIRGRKFLHGPVESGNCAACHNVHGAGHARLLREQFTEDFYASFDPGNYALCFSCHDRALVTEPRTANVTDFRDGDLNLHFLHVNRERRGRTCRACHDMHGSDLPRHMAETVPFEGSGWAMPIGFQPNETGGSCAPGCHAPMSYDRFKRLPAPEATEGGAP
jgi:predicted CXXCH cytochrome family protein